MKSINEIIEVMDKYYIDKYFSKRINPQDINDGKITYITNLHIIDKKYKLEIIIDKSDERIFFDDINNISIDELYYENIHNIFFDDCEISDEKINLLYIIKFIEKYKKI